MHEKPKLHPSAITLTFTHYHCCFSSSVELHGVEPREEPSLWGYRKRRGHGASQPDAQCSLSPVLSDRSGNQLDVPDSKFALNAIPGRRAPFVKGWPSGYKHFIAESKHDTCIVSTWANSCLNKNLVCRYIVVVIVIYLSKYWNTLSGFVNSQEQMFCELFTCRTCE